jgi:ABC-type phosphate transport system permease subunit
MSNQYGLPPQQQGWPGQPPQVYQQPMRSAPRKRRRVFMWVFFAIQAIFIIWLVAGLATVHTGPTHAQLASACYNHNWWPLFKSQADCVTHYGGALTDAGNVGKGIGAAIIVIVWVVIDMILGITYGVYRLATRDRYR